jgi:uncharacterized protein (TIGR02217 family)
MSFDNVVLPLTPARIHSADRWSDTIVQAGGGSEVRNAWWSDALKAWEVSFASVITLAQFQSLRAHINGRRGRVRSFPFLDHTDYTATVDAFGTGDNTAGPFLLKVARGDSGNAYTREVYRPISASDTVYVNAVAKVRATDYSIDYTSGLCTFLPGHFPANGTALTWTGQFYHAARWDISASDFGDLFMWVDGGRQLVQTEPVRLVETRDYQ